MQILYDHTNQDNAFIVDNYPWGYTLKTQRRYWIETTSRGDRFVFQTLNPKTDKWCKEKKSTYMQVMFLIKKDNGHISYIGHSCMYTNMKDLDNFLSKIDESKLSEQQRKQIKKSKVVYKTREHITYEIAVRKWRNKTTGEIVTSINPFEMSNYEEYKTDEDTAREEKNRQAEEDLPKIYSYYHNRINA